MTDNEIVKALDCCSKMHKCRECVFWEMHSAQCVSELLSNTLDLINRQKAEIEMLTNNNKKLLCENLTINMRKTELKNKCGSCIYAVPSTFGKSDKYVECANREHTDKYCKRPISIIRQRTNLACRSYKMTEDEI